MRREVVKEYMAACTESITEGLIISAWRRSGIRPLNPEVFTEEDYAPSYASSVNPPLPVSFPNLDNSPEASSSGQHAANESNEDQGAESDAMMEMSGLNVTRGSLSTMLPDPEISAFSVQPTPPAPSISSNETRRFLHEEGRSDPPGQPSAKQSMQQPFMPPPPVNSTQRQTRSLSRSLSQSLSHHASTPSTSQSVSSEYARMLERRIEELEKASERRIEELEKSSEEWRTHCHFMKGVISQLQNQLNAKEKKKGTHAKRTQVEARVLTSEEGRLELQQLREEARLKEERQAEDAARKATEDEARRKRRADGSRVFTGPLNKTRRKGDLEDIAAALALPDGGKKDELLERISKHFEEHPELKTSTRFEGLFNLGPRKRARLADVPPVDLPVAGPSTVREPALPPRTIAVPPHSSPFVFRPTTPFDSTSTPYYNSNTFYFP
jgi:hypothetical protein